MAEAAFDIAGMAESLGVQGLPLDLQDRKSCCSALYELEPVRLLLGETLHPGGLGLTHRLGKLAGIERDDMVLDLACGRGTSAMALARSFHCRVIGADLGRGSIAEARSRARESGMDGRVSFLCADGESLPLGTGAFDVALCECSMSLFPDKPRGVAEVARLLRPGGRFAVSDVTVEPGSLPEELNGTLGQVLCLADAPSVDGYRRLLSSHGLTLIQEQDASDSVMKLLGDVAGKLAAFRVLLSLKGSSDGIADLIAGAFPLIERVKTLVGDGKIGYWLFVAEKEA